MSSELERLIDGLGEQLGRSIAVEDVSLRLLAYNAYTGDVDDLRVNSIMRRAGPRELARFVHELCPRYGDAPFVVPSRPDLGLTIERIVMPVRDRNRLLGFMWLLASDGPLSRADIGVLRQAGKQVAHKLQQQHLFDELRQGRIQELLRDLLSGDRDTYGGAAGRLIEEDLIIAGPVSALAVVIPQECEHPLGVKTRRALEIGLQQGSVRAAPRAALHMVMVDHGVVVVAHADGSAVGEVDDLAAAIQYHVSEATGCPLEQCHVGIGEVRPTLSEVHGSYLEARRAAEVAGLIRMLGNVVRYSRLSVYGLLAELPKDSLRHNLPPGLRRLLEHDDPALTSTLEAFLNNAGDMRRTAAQLKLHRASVDYRLRKVERIAQVDLSSGEDRLTLHLGFKMAQLIQLR